MDKKNKYIVGLLIFFFLSITYSNQNKNKLETKVTSTLWCFGRLHFELPKEFVLTKHEQVAQNVNVNTISVKTKKQANSLWEHYVKRIRLDKGKNSIQSKEINLGSNFMGLFIQRNDKYSKQKTLVAQKGYSDHILQVRFSGNTKNGMQDIVKLIVNAYKPKRKTGFCLPHGSLETGESIIETNRLKFANKSNDVTITLNAKSIVSPAKEQNTNQYFADKINYLKKSGGDGIVISNKKVKYANFSGKEGKIEALIDGKKYLYYSWQYPGTPNNGSKPKIEIKASAPKGKKKLLNFTWQMLRNSIKSTKSLQSANNN